MRIQLDVVCLFSRFKVLSVALRTVTRHSICLPMVASFLLVTLSHWFLTEWGHPFAWTKLSRFQLHFTISSFSVFYSHRFALRPRKLRLRKCVPRWWPQASVLADKSQRVSAWGIIRHHEFGWSSNRDLGLVLGERWQWWNCLPSRVRQR